MKNTFENINKRYQELKAEREKYVKNWEEVAKYVGIRFRAQQYFNEAKSDKSEDLDKWTEDPTASLSVQQSADYLKGIMWGGGDGVISLVPSDELLKMGEKEKFQDWFEYASYQLLAQMNHPKAGLNTALSACMYDEQAFGTGGVGAFPNSAHSLGLDSNVLLFRPYGVDTLCIDEGKNGLPEVVFNTYQWRVNRIISEFCEVDGVIDEKLLEKMPSKIKNSFKANKLNDVYTIVQGIVPSDEFVVGAEGKRGCRYYGYWFEESEKKFFREENYREMPIAVARAIKLRGEVYGRSSGTMLISTIRCINSAVSIAMQAMGKMVNPPIGILNTALFGDDVVDTSENGLTVFNAAQLQGNSPITPMLDIGDPTTLVNWLVPYLNEKVATAFKIDILLDFSAQSDMTATEAMQRFSIRGRSISGMINQQKTELFEPLIRRCVSICMDKEVLGLDPYGEEAAIMAEMGRNEMIIPEEVMQCISEGKQWFKIRFNNEVEKLGKTDKIDDLMKLINTVMAIMQINPQIAMAVNWYQLLSDATEALGQKQCLLEEKKFKEIIEQQNAMQQQLMSAQASEYEAQANRNNASAIKDLTNEQSV